MTSFSVVTAVVLLLNAYLSHGYSLKFVPKQLQKPEFQVRLSQGVVQGGRKYTKSHTIPYYSFEGIPYALPPVGDLRFRPPVPANKWNDTLNATTMDVPSCVQVTPSIINGLIESEDCLYINVYTPINNLENVTAMRSLPVMVWIYGGGFISGSANASYFGPDNLLEEYVVVVHFGYRLASFGFLSTEDMESPGNYGLKDQHLALRWVNRNIRSFGGDPNKTTIFGESAGSASVQYQMMYPNNQGLFRAAISQSGSALCVWAYQKQPKKIAFELGKIAGMDTDSTSQLVAYLRNITTEQLKTATMKTSLKNAFGIINGIPFAPVLEPKHRGAFLTGKNHQLLVQGQFMRVPHLLGFTSAEAAIAKTALDLANPLLRVYDIDLSMWVPTGMNAGNKTDEVGKTIREYYFNTTQSRSDQYLEYVNDAYFFRPIIESARLISRLAPTYLYEFSYEGLLGRLAKGNSEVDDYKGALHTEEMAYIWSQSFLPEPNGTDRVIRARMIKLWTNFAKTGNPTPEKDPLFENMLWPTVSGNLTYLDIDTIMSVKQNFKKETMAFWKKIYDKYGMPPYDTY